MLQLMGWDVCDHFLGTFDGFGAGENPQFTIFQPDNHFIAWLQPKLSPILSWNHQPTTLRNFCAHSIHTCHLEEPVESRKKFTTWLVSTGPKT